MIRQRSYINSLIDMAGGLITHTVRLSFFAPKNDESLDVPNFFT
ncbi:hypothetical protein SAMN05428952_10065 [Nitrosomonas sp. Nm132]|jgi:hypothetical protein|nr:hypothetical protein SAMN05428952_10065 [Nitrosomonas sp. Nm132]